MAACIIAIFTDLYPRVMVSSTNSAYDLTVHNTASGAYSLKVMTVVVILFLPLVLAYQTWTYYVFRKRVSRQDFLPAAEQSAAAGPVPRGDARPGDGGGRRRRRPGRRPGQLTGRTARSPSRCDGRGPGVAFDEQQASA